MRTFFFLMGVGFLAYLIGSVNASRPIPYGIA
jgi:hypothetical protein